MNDLTRKSSNRLTREQEREASRYFGKHVTPAKAAVSLCFALLTAASPMLLGLHLAVTLAADFCLKNQRKESGWMLAAAFTMITYGITVFVPYHSYPDAKKPMNTMNEMKEKELLCDELMKDISGGQIINRDILENYIRRMKALGHSKAAVVGTIVSYPEVNSFSTDPMGDMNSLYALASELYEKA